LPDCDFEPESQLCPAQLAGLLDVKCDLTGERIDIVEFLFRPQVAHELHLDIFAINVAIKVE